MEVQQYANAGLRSEVNAMPPSGSQQAFWLLHGPEITFSSPVPSALMRQTANGSAMVRFQLKRTCLPS